MLECSHSRLFSHLAKFPSTFSRALSTTRCLFTHYDTLKVNRSASAKEIKSAYLKLSKEYHPDRNPNDPHSHDRFVKLQEAYQTLGNADSKRNYDASLGPGGYRSNTSRPYGRPDFTQRDEWLRADKERREKQFRDAFRKPQDYNDFYQRYNQPHHLSPEEMEQFHRMRNFSKSGKEMYVALGVGIVAVLLLELYFANRRRSKFRDYYGPFDDPMVTSNYNRDFDLEYKTQKLINDQKYREYLNREIEKGNVGSIEKRNQVSPKT